MPKKSSTSKLVYPTGLVTPDTDLLHIMVLQYEPPSTKSASGTFTFRSSDAANRVVNSKSTRILGDIFLPVPSNINDEKSVGWKDSTLNPIAADIIDQLGGLAGDFSYENLTSNAGAAFGAAGQRVSQVLDKYRGALSDAGVGDTLETFLTGKAINIAGANVDLNDLITRRSGQVLNPNLELLFKSVNLRRFNYSFNLTPRTRQESNTCKGIIRTFKKRMSPKSTVGSGSGRGLFISSPDVFQLQFKKGLEDHPFLHDHKICALTDMNVNYTGTGTYATYEDATPVSMTLNLTFTELSPVYQEDYGDNPGADEGVGF